MCGICGIHYFDATRPVETVVLKKMQDALRHRGPDEAGSFCDGGIGLASRRLAVIDLHLGSQPVANEDESIIAVVNGEIYNYVELKLDLVMKGHDFRSRGDSEVLVHAFEEYGFQSFSRLRGMFAVAIWDRRDRRLVLARDRFGKKPLFTLEVGSDGVVFASEIKALRPYLSSFGIEPRVSHQAVYDYLSLGSVPQPRTIFEEIQAVPAGCVLEYKSETKYTNRYWEPVFLPKSNCTYHEAVYRVRDQVSEATRIRLRSDVPVGVFLSGGLDSSIVAYEASRAASKRVRSFTVSTGSEDLDEGPTAARTAARFGLEHTELRLDIAPLKEVLRIAHHFDQPFGDSSAIPTLCVSRLAREHVTVVLNGDGGDEVFAGYRRYLAAFSAGFLTSRVGVGWLASALSGIRADGRRSAAGFVKRFGRGLALNDGERWLVWTPDLLTETMKSQVWRGDKDLIPTENRIEEYIDDNLSLLDKFVSTDLKFILLSDLLVKMDMASMAASLEARSPFLDHKVAEFAFRLAPRVRLHRGRLKGLLRDSYRDVLPSEVINSRKQGFEVPVASWLKNDLSELISETLGNSHPLVTEFVDVGFVKGILRDGNQFSGNVNQLIYALLMLELWLRSARDI